MLITGNDTGPMHIAAIVKTPCIAIFSNTNNPGKFYPQNQNNMIFKKRHNNDLYNILLILARNKFFYLKINLSKL